MSAKVYVTADLHLGHVNMATKRGFSSVEEHDHHIISNWNKVVTKRDTVWILGDVTNEKASYEILGQLNGIINVVGGNHDRPQHTIKMLEYINGFCGAKQLKGFMLTHIPIHPSELERFRGNIHGHVHDQSIYEKGYFNVSLENTLYYPVLLDDIIRIYEEESSGVKVIFPVQKKEIVEGHGFNKPSFRILEDYFIPENFSECYIEVFDPNHELSEQRFLKYKNSKIMVSETQHNGNTTMLLVSLVTNRPIDKITLEKGEYLSYA